MRLFPVLTLVTGAVGFSLGEHRLDARQNQDKPHLPTEPGTATNCNVWWDNKGFVPCDSVLNIFEVSLDSFRKWNPAITSKCGNFKSGFSYCVGTSGQDPEPATTTTVPPTTTTNPGNGIETPSPIQEGLTKDCKTFHLVKTTTTCASIMNYYSLTWEQVFSWNPAVGKDCLNLQSGTYACVGVLSPAPTTTTTGNGIATPTPIQEGMTKQCTQWHLVKSTTTCNSILNYYSLSWADFYSWNPAVGKDCLNLWTGTYACVAAKGSTSTPTTTIAGNGIVTPTPVQEGITPRCKTFHLVKTTTTCASIMNYYNLSWEQVFAWNPAVGKDCRNLWANYYACVGVL